MSAAIDTRRERLGFLFPEHRGEVMESLLYLQCIPYSEYRQTRWWRYRREAFAEGCTKCACCRCPRSDHPVLPLPKFHVHHLTYENIGQEPDEDLAYVCSPCHNLIHRPDSHAAQNWVLYHGTSLAAEAEAMRP